MDLIAVWEKGTDEYYDAPSIVRWADGRTATEKDYLDHIADTHFWVDRGVLGREKHMLPDVVAQVTFDPFGGVWAAKGEGVEPRGLNLSDPGATDDQIYFALNTGNWTYRMVVHRGS